jgi:ribose transport system ATP-binding protein
VHHGRAFLQDEALTPNDYPRNAAMGLVYLSEDRKEDGLFLRLSVTLNLLAALGRSGGGGGVVRRYLEELGIAAASPAVDVGTLSGGNQQKVLLGKWLATEPRVLILDEPTRGVDVGAKRKIHEAVTALADRGAAVLLISSDLPELAGLSDRAVIMRNGHLIGELPKQALSEEALLLAANGQLGECHAEA